MSIWSKLKLNISSNLEKIVSITKNQTHFIIKLFLFKFKIKHNDKIFITGKQNLIDIASNINLQGTIKGDNNRIIIEEGSKLGANFNFSVNIEGNNNEIVIKQPYNVRFFHINIGNHGPINNCKIFIDELTSMVGVVANVFQHGSKLTIGKNCTLSEKIEFRTGEYPHLIFDKNTGEYLDKGSNIVIGDHCWIGEGVTLLKNASIANDSIIGCYSIVTKPFYENFVVIAGNPASVKKRDVYFVRNELFLDKSSIYYKSFEEYRKKHNGYYIGNEIKEK